MDQVFIRYANEDQATARKLAEVIEAQGHTVFRDHEIPPGKEWADVIEGAERAATCVVVLWSPHSVESRWVRLEARRGLERKALIPALIDDVEEIPMEFSDIQAADLRGWKGETTPKLQQLLALTRHQTLHRNPGPAGDHIGNIPLFHLFPQQGLSALLTRLELLLQFVAALLHAMELVVLQPGRLL